VLGTAADENTDSFFKAATAAYNILKNPITRGVYECFGWDTANAISGDRPQNPATPGKGAGLNVTHHAPPINAPGYCFVRRYDADEGNVWHTFPANLVGKICRGDVHGSEEPSPDEECSEVRWRITYYCTVSKYHKVQGV